MTRGWCWLELVTERDFDFGFGQDGWVHSRRFAYGGETRD